MAKKTLRCTPLNEITFFLHDGDGEELGSVYYDKDTQRWSYENRVQVPHEAGHRFDHPINAVATLLSRLTPP